MHQNNHQLPVSEHDISHNMFDMLVFLMVLCTSAKKATVSDTAEIPLDRYMPVFTDKKSDCTGKN